MTGNALLRKLRRYAKEHGVRLRLVSHRGKGSHVTLYPGARRTVLKDRKQEIGPGLLNAILRQLGIEKHDID